MAIEIILNGDNSSAVKELHDLEILASVEKGSVSASITTEQLTLVNEYAELVRNYIAGGANGTTNGIFEALPIQIQENGINVFDGYLDFLNDFEIVDPTTVRSRIKKYDSNDNFQDRANGLTFGYLDAINVISTNDYIQVPYLIETPFNFVEFAFVGVTIYIIGRDTVYLINNVIHDVGIVAADLAGGAIGSVGAAIMAIAIVVVNAAVALFMVNALVQLIIELVAYLIQPVKYHKAMRVDTLLEKACLFLDLGYNTSISDISKLVLLPSKTEVNQDYQQGFILAGVIIHQPGKGIPSTADYGYTFAELLDAINKTFNAEYAVINGVLEHHSKNSSFWIQQSGYTLPDILQESIVTNANELISDNIIIFKSDINDFHTLENYLGTTYEIRTRPLNPALDGRNVLMNGFGKVEIPYALGNRKDSLNAFEKFVENLFQKIDDLVNWFPLGSSSLAGKMDGRIGYLKLESDYVHVPKLMKMTSSYKLGINHRSYWSAKYLYTVYHNENSFVLNNFGNQYYVYKSVRVPFGFEEFNQLTQNSYFYNQNGDICKLEKISWNVSKDFATLDYRVKTKYTNNLTENYIEQS